MSNLRENMPPRLWGPNAPGPIPQSPFPGTGPGPGSFQRQQVPAPPRVSQRAMEPEMRGRLPKPNVQVTQHGMDPGQEQHQKEEGCATHRDNPFPPVNSNQIISGKLAEQATRIGNHCTTESSSSILASLGLSIEDLEELSRYPDDQLTPESMPLILREIRMRKMTRRLPNLPAQSREKEMFHSDDGRGTKVKWKVIDYGHESKYEYAETPLEVKAYNSDASTEGSVKGFPTQQTALISSAPSGVTSSQMNAVKGWIQKMGFQQSTPSTESFSPIDASNKGPELGLPPAGAGIPPPLGVVKASWLPVFSQTDAQKLKRLPAPSLTNDYSAASPKIFPHVCSLCNVECRHLQDWNLHLRTTAHSEKCDQLRQQHEGDKKETHIPLSCSTSSNPNSSQHTIPSHASSQTLSRPRSPEPHSRKRSRSKSSERCRTKQSRSRSSESCRRKPLQYRSSERCSRRRSRSKSSERCRTKRSRSRSSESCRRRRSRSKSSERCKSRRSRSRSSERYRRKRSRSKSSERFRRRRSQSKSSERFRRRRSRSKSPECFRRRRSRSKSPERFRRRRSQSKSSEPWRRKRSRSKSPEGFRRKPSESRIPRYGSRYSERPSSPSSRSQMSSSQKRELGRSTRSPALASSAGEGRSRQPPVKSDVAEQAPNKSEHPQQTNPGHQELPKKEAETQELTPLVEQSAMQALSLLQSGGAVGEELAQGTSLPPLPPVPIVPASLSLVSMIQLVATQVVQAALASKEPSSVQESPSVAVPTQVVQAPLASKEPSNVQKSPCVAVPTQGVQAPLASKKPSSVQKSPSVAVPTQGVQAPLASKKPSSVQKSPSVAVPTQEVQAPLASKKPSSVQKGPSVAVPTQGLQAPLASKKPSSVQKNPSVALPTQGAQAPLASKKPSSVQKGASVALPTQGVQAPLASKKPSSVQKSPTVAGPTQGVQAPLASKKPSSVQKSPNVALPTQGVQAPLASKKPSSVQKSPSVSGPSPQLSNPAGSKEKKQESSREVVPGVPPSFSGPSALHVWIVGHGIVHWAGQRAANSGLGRRLGLPDHVSVSWVSKVGMLWEELLPMLRLKVSTEGIPAAVVLQLGENDLQKTPNLTLRIRMQLDLDLLAAELPGVKILWSQMLPRCVCYGNPHTTDIERVRKQFQSVVAEKVLALGGSLICHPGIDFCDASLYMKDGVHLSFVGNDMWLAEVSAGIRAWLQE